MFLAIYIGPTLAFILTPLLLAPLLRLTHDYQLTSLADLFAFRYNSQLAGVLVTLFMLASTLPYIALQIRAVTESLKVLTQDEAPLELGLIFCMTLTVFAILFGARHVSPREKHAGLVLAIAFESLVKLAAILAVGLFAVFGVFDGPATLDRWLQNNPEALQNLYEPLDGGPWLTLILLSFAASFLLPRQFYMNFIENPDSRSLSTASWAFPLFLLLFNLAIPPILWAGQQVAANVNPEYYVLGVTLYSGSAVLPTIAFIGGISAASAMVIVTTLALSQMALNHILLPASYPDPAVDMYRWLLWGRRMLIALIILTAYGLYLILERNSGLVQLGLISFVAVAQCLPGIIGVLFWQRATRAGFLAGLLTGGAIWYVTLLMPLLVKAGLFTLQFDLLAYLGSTDQDPWEFVTFWSLSLNTLLFVSVSLLTRQSAGERRAVAACFQDNAFPPDRHLVTAVTSPDQFQENLSGLIGASAGSTEVANALRDLHMDASENRPKELRRLRDRIERNLSGMLGPMLARMIVDERLQADEGTRSMLADHMRFIEDRLEQSHSRLRGLARELDNLRRYHRQILEDLPLGVCALTAEREILSWNQAMERLSGIDREAAIGGPLRSLPSPWGSVLEQFLDRQAQHLHKIRCSINGRLRWFNLHKAAIEPLPRVFESPGSAYWGGMVLLVEDLTEVQTLEAELAHSERLASVGRLAAGIAHEIGNPVTGIACLTQNLRFEDEPAIIAESLEDILVQTRRISDILKSLSTFSHGGRPEDQRFTLFDLNECLADAQRLVQLSREGKNLHYHMPPRSEQLMIEADQQRLLQVFVNLLTNACDASRSGDHITVTATQENRDWVITVRDQGAGIPEALRERIFEPFFTTKDPGRGTGLGLHLVYSIIRDHRGTVSIQDNFERGTCVTLRLPLRQTTGN
jgi:PAS domain S-box-containing protein